MKRITHSLNYEAVCRTAPATPGLLISLNILLHICTFLIYMLRIVLCMKGHVLYYVFLICISGTFYLGPSFQIYLRNYFHSCSHTLQSGSSIFSTTISPHHERLTSDGVGAELGLPQRWHYSHLPTHRRSMRPRL